MNKKIMAITIAVLLSSTGLVTIALAQKGQGSTGMGKLVPDIWYDPINPTISVRPIYPQVTVVNGVGLNKNTMATEPVVILEIKYSNGSTTIEIIPGDVDGDCDVDNEDVELLLASYGKSSGEIGYNSNADFNHDGIVDFDDVVILVKNYGKTCPSTTIPIPTTKYYMIVDGDIYRMKKIYESYDPDTTTKVYQFEAEDGSVMTAIVQHYSDGTRSISAEFKNYLITFEPMYNYGPRIAGTEPFRITGQMKKIIEETGINIEEIQTGQIAEWLE